MLADRAEALDDDPRSGQRQPNTLARHIDRDREAEPGSTDLVERDAANLAW